MEKGVRSERALHVSLAEMYLQGVSTRKVTNLLESLCGLSVSSTQVSRTSKLLDEEFSQWRNRSLGQYKHLFLDALYEKVRQGGNVLDGAVLVVYGIDADGKVASCLRLITGVLVEINEGWSTGVRYLPMGK